MIVFLTPYFTHSDERGAITGLCNSFSFEECNLISSRKGTVRGGHYHKHTREMFIILQGRIEILLFHVNAPQETQKHIVSPTQCFIINPFVVHHFTMLEDSMWINALNPKMSAQDKDFFTL